MTTDISPQSKMNKWVSQSPDHFMAYLREVHGKIETVIERRDRHLRSLKGSVEAVDEHGLDTYVLDRMISIIAQLDSLISKWDELADLGAELQEKYVEFYGTEVQPLSNRLSLFY